MENRHWPPGWVLLLLTMLTLSCAVLRQTPQPVEEIPQLSFEIQTATPTVSLLFDAPTNTPDPNATHTPTATPTLTATVTLSGTAEVSATTVAAAPAATDTPPSPAEAPPAAPVPPPDTPTPAPPVELAEPLRGGDWDFEAGFIPWVNPFGDSCDGSGLAVGWSAFTTRDDYGSSCMNQTTWAGNVHSGESAQEITFAFVGNQAGVYKSAPTTPGHQYTVEAFMKREFSPAKLEVQLGIDAGGGTNWEADTVQWFPWQEDVDDAWGRTEATITAAAESITIFIKGSHPYPEPGGALRLDNISVVDLGPPQ